MSWLEALWQAIAPSRIEWRLFDHDLTMECHIANVPAGAEIRYVYRGQLYHSFVHHTRADALDEARQKRAELIERGWAERACGQDVAHTS